ncbi:MAG TPA: polyprenyl synthetase family protein [Candidatus Saccharimonadales bacterium]|nr:polyprenyl synthetase family protein [Candidatus Saccharimonadales bacterium]
MKAILAYSPLLHTKIRKTIAAEQAKPNHTGSWRTDFLKRLAPYATGGKLIRGSLVCFSYEAFAGQKPTPEIIDVAIALELIHSALLMHDDVMDNDDFRRGRPSFHNQYKKIGRRQGLVEPERFGANMAICAADMCLFLAQRLLADAPLAVHELFGDVLIEVCDGQMQDIYSQARPHAPSKQAIYNLMRAKTASYTLSLPLAVGAALAGQPPATVNKLRRLGDAAGTIFQIRDDELGIMGDTNKTGKPVGADIREGKKTLIYYYLMKTCDIRERHRLREIFGNPDIGLSDIAAVQKFIKQHNITRLLGVEIQRLEGRALRTLETIDLPNQYKTELKSLIAFCAQRQA